MVSKPTPCLKRMLKWSKPENFNSYFDEVTMNMVRSENMGEMNKAINFKNKSEIVNLLQANLVAWDMHKWSNDAKKVRVSQNASKFEQISVQIQTPDAQESVRGGLSTYRTSNLPKNWTHEKHWYLLVIHKVSALSQFDAPWQILCLHFIIGKDQTDNMLVAEPSQL